MRTKELKQLSKDQLGPPATTEGLPEAVARPIESMHRADLVVGIPVLNDAPAVSTVIDVVGRGLVDCYPDLRSVLIVAVGGATDETRRLAELAPVPPQVTRLVADHPGVPGKGRALKLVFQAARYLQARACLVIEPDVRSVQPAWVELLAQPILDGGYDFVAPGYLRAPLDDPLEDLLVYPLTRALYRMSVRHPLGGDSALSYLFVRDLLDVQDWTDQVGGWGLDAWIVTLALAQGRKVAEAHLGLKVHDPAERGRLLAPRCRDVAATLLDLNARISVIWRSATGPVLGPATSGGLTFGVPPHVEPVPAPIVFEELLGGFRSGCSRSLPLWEGVLGRETAAWLKEQAYTFQVGPFFPGETWSRIVYAFLIAAGRGVHPPAELAEALEPIFQGEVASFVLQTRGLPRQAAELEVQKLANLFDEQRLTLLRQWEEQVVRAA